MPLFLCVAVSVSQVCCFEYWWCVLVLCMGFFLGLHSLEVISPGWQSVPISTMRLLILETFRWVLKVLWMMLCFKWDLWLGFINPWWYALVLKCNLAVNPYPCLFLFDSLSSLFLLPHMWPKGCCVNWFEGANKISICHAFPESLGFQCYRFYQAHSIKAIIQFQQCWSVVLQRVNVTPVWQNCTPVIPTH